MKIQMNPLNDIVAGLDQLRSAGKSGSWIDPENEWCVTFEVNDSGTEGNPFWLQVTAATLNMQYLDEDDPSARLPKEVEQFPAFPVVAWDIGLYATFTMPPDFAPQLPSLLDRTFQQYYGLLPDYQVHYKVENMGV